VHEKETVKPKMGDCDKARVVAILTSLLQGNKLHATFLDCLFTGVVSRILTVLS